MPAAVIGGAIVAAGGIGAAAIGSSAQSRASRDATQAAQDSTAQNAALFREARAENMQVLSPFVGRGNAAGNQINALLGLGGRATNNAGTASASTLDNSGATAGPYPQDFIRGGGNVLDQIQVRSNDGNFARNVMGIGGDVMAPGVVSGIGGGTFNANGTPATVGTQGQPAPQTAQQAANDAFNIVKNSTGYQFRVNEGQNALNSGYAGSGLLQSGAALRALDDYRQNMASNEFGNYMAYLGNQQGVGLSAGSAIAGVSQNYANNMASQNNAMASTIANSALARGQGNAQLWGGVGNALGQFGGVIAGSGYNPFGGQTNAYGISGAGNIY
ncbi:hypothetical protein [Sphingomonas sp.]|uniref:hypothetical protein n=1 Tax=Sphingomonas sp. TaxID=28214 RepID=UPI003BADB2C9